MTTVYLSDKLCFMCGAKSKYPMGNLSMGNVGVRDFDGRPTHILRSSVYLWIQRCPSCGYCAPEIAEGSDDDRVVVNSDHYRSQLSNESFPETANSFLCYGAIMKNRKLFADAGWAAMFASWICDDNGYRESAYICRGRAIDYFSSARHEGQEYADTPDLEQLYLIDLHRRRSQFDLAARLCDEALEREHEDHILDILYLERELIDKRDSAAHNDAELDSTD